MSESAEFETLDQLKATGASSDRLREWRRRNLLPTYSEKPGLGRGAGSESRYPAGTRDTVVRIQELLREKRNLDYVGWKLWAEGYPVAEFIRDALRDWAETLNQRVDKLEKHLEKALDHPELMELLKPPRGLGWIRLSLTDEHFPWLLRIITEAYKGRNAGIWDEARPAFARLIGNVSDRAGWETRLVEVFQSDPGILIEAAVVLLPKIADFVSQLSQEQLRALRRETAELEGYWGAHPASVGRVHAIDIVRFHVVMLAAVGGASVLDDVAKPESTTDLGRVTQESLRNGFLSLSETF